MEKTVTRQQGKTESDVARLLRGATSRRGFIGGSLKIIGVSALHLMSPATRAFAGLIMPPGTPLKAAYDIAIGAVMHGDFKTGELTVKVTPNKHTGDVDSVSYALGGLTDTDEVFRAFLLSRQKDGDKLFVVQNVVQPDFKFTTPKTQTFIGAHLGNPIEITITIGPKGGMALFTDLETKATMRLDGINLTGREFVGKKRVATVNMIGGQRERPESVVSTGVHKIIRQHNNQNVTIPVEEFDLSKMPPESETLLYTYSFLGFLNTGNTPYTMTINGKRIQIEPGKVEYINVYTSHITSEERRLAEGETLQLVAKNGDVIATAGLGYLKILRELPEV